MKKTTVILGSGQKIVIKTKKKELISIFDCNIKGKYEYKSEEYEFIAKVKFIITYISCPTITDIKIVDLKFRNKKCSSNNTHDYCSIYESSSCSSNSCSSSSSIENSHIYQKIYTTIKNFFNDIDVKVKDNCSFIKLYLRPSFNIKLLEIHLKFYRCSFFELFKYIGFIQLMYYLLKYVLLCIYNFFIYLFGIAKNNKKYFNLNNNNNNKKYTINKLSPFIQKNLYNNTISSSNK